ncbi:hypothetical protein AaE_012113, partial [Aphanomyces astaci]
AIRMLCYDLPADALDEYVGIGESTAMLSFKYIIVYPVSVSRKLLSTEYERDPTAMDVQRCLSINAKRGFPGLFGCLDCTHLSWDKFPVAYQGQYQGRSGDRSIIMEAVAGPDLWIWHSYIGLPGSNNDINVLDRSPLVEKLIDGVAPHCNYTVNGTTYSMAYLLVDGIYPNWPIFMKTISHPEGDKRKWYAKRQEAVRKDVERSFGVLQKRFAVLRNPCRLWNVEDIIVMWRACIILHNMIIEDERVRQEWYPTSGATETNYISDNYTWSEGPTYNMILAGVDVVQDEAAYFKLREDLIAHLWTSKSANSE